MNDLTREKDMTNGLNDLTREEYDKYIKQRGRYTKGGHSIPLLLEAGNVQPTNLMLEPFGPSLSGQFVPSARSNSCDRKRAHVNETGAPERKVHGFPFKPCRAATTFRSDSYVDHPQ